jgi:hypothetical protein
MPFAVVSYPRFIAGLEIITNSQPPNWTGHILCLTCCKGLACPSPTGASGSSSRQVPLCPFCRLPFALARVRPLRADFTAGEPESFKEELSSSSLTKSVANPSPSKSPKPRPPIYVVDTAVYDRGECKQCALFLALFPHGSGSACEDCRILRAPRVTSLIPPQPRPQPPLSPFCSRNRNRHLCRCDECTRRLACATRSDNARRTRDARGTLHSCTREPCVCVRCRTLRALDGVEEDVRNGQDSETLRTETKWKGAYTSCFTECIIM